MFIARRHVTLAAAALFAVAGCSQTRTPAAAPPLACEGKTMLWQVSGPGGQSGWIYGTVHALPEGSSWMDNRISSALAKADMLVMEIADPANRSASQRAFAALSTNEGLPPLAQRLPASIAARLPELIDQLDLDSAQLDNLESWAAAMTIASAASAAKGRSRSEGVETTLSETMPKLAISGLETADSQLSLFDRLSETDQRYLLALTINDALKPEDASAPDPVAGWCAGDAAAIAQAGDSSFLASPVLRQTLLIERNQAWVVKVAGLMRSGRQPFIAVGAAHVVGDDGLPAALTRNGYRVTLIR